MGKRIVLWLCLMLAVACCAQAEVLHASPDELSLTQALASCIDGDVIELADGVYAEPSEAFPLVIDRAVTLRAAPGASPVIDAPKFVAALRVEADGVTLSGLDIRMRRTGIYAIGDGLTLERCAITLADPAWRTSSCGIWAGGVKDVNGAPVIFDRGAVKPGVDCGYKTAPDGTQHLSATNYQLNIGSQPFLKVNRFGKRFGNESVPYDTFCNMASYQPGGVWCQVFDGSAIEDINTFKTTGCAAYTTAMLGLGIPLDDYMWYVDGGAEMMMKADTLDELADMLGFEGDNKAAFLQQIDDYNALVDSGEDTQFGKEPHRLSRIDTAPFYGCWYGGSLLTTTDGLRIDKDMRVLDENDNVIEGLFAAGDVSGCFFSDNYPEYLVACACGRTCTEGRHAAKYIAAMD